MRTISLKSTHLASLIFVATLLTALFTAIFVGAAGEVTITEDSLLLTDGSNSMTGDLNMSQNQIEYGVFHKGSTPPASPVEGQYFYDTDDHIFYVWNSTHWLSQSGGDTGPQGPAGTVEGLPFNYLVFVNATSTYMVNGTTGIIDWSSTNSTDILQAAIGNLSSTYGGKIFIKPPFASDDIITVNKKMVVIEATAGDESENAVWIRRLKIDSTSTWVRNCRFMGLTFNEIHLYQNSNGISDIEFYDCVVKKTTTYSFGIVFEGTGEMTTGVYHIRWNGCHFQFQSPVSGAMFKYRNCLGVTEIYATDCHFQMTDDNQILVLVEDDGVCDGMFLINPRIIQVALGQTGLVFFDMEVRSGSISSGYTGIYWLGGRVEMHSNYTIFHVPVQTYGGIYFNAMVEGVQFGRSSGANCTVFDCPNHWWEPNQEIMITGNTFRSGSGSVSLGIAVFGHRHHIVIKDNIGLNPFGLISTPFDTSGTTRIVVAPFGDEAAPTASNAYLVQCTGIYIISTDSGNTDCSIDVKDVNGNALISGASTLGTANDPLWIPRGYTINWGAFTGTAPTVTVYFE